MYNPDLVAERLDIIRAAVKRLKLLAQVPLDEFSRNEDYIDIAENRLRRAIEALFDLGRHLVVKTGAGVPKDYRSVIDLLRYAGIIPGEFAGRIAGMAGYRNRLIHEYNKVTPEELHYILQDRLADFEVFCQHIVDYVRNQ